MKIITNYAIFAVLSSLTLIMTSCKQKSNTKNVDFAADISIKNSDEELEIYKNGTLCLRVSLIGNSGQVIVFDSGDEISKLHWFYGEKRVGEFIDYKSKKVYSGEHSKITN